jgi:hypothetical protein
MLTYADVCRHDALSKEYMMTDADVCYADVG